MKKPVIFLAFSNDIDNYLPMINKERENIYEVLQDRHDKGCIQVHKQESADIDGIFKQFSRYHNRIAIFHFGGHASGTKLKLESSVAHAEGLAGLLGKERELQLVFLNGCATKDQVKLLWDAGVKAVIATSVPIEDEMAVEFAEQFYRTLAEQEQATILDAFSTAQSFINAKYGPLRKIEIFRDKDAQLKVGDIKEKKEVPWGLYISQKNLDVLKWRLPDVKDEEGLSKEIEALNKELTETLYTEVVRNKPDIKESIDERVRKKTTIDSFPTPVGEHLRKLILETKTFDSWLKQAVCAYKTLTELLSFTMVSQLWETKFKNPKMIIAAKYQKELQNFFALEAENYREFNFMTLIEAIAWILGENKIGCFVEELCPLGKSFREKDEFYRANLFMEEVKRKVIENEIRKTEDELKSLCHQVKNHLGIIFAKLAFFVRYKFTSVKSINVIKHRYKEPRFSHKTITLEQASLEKDFGGPTEVEKDYDSFMESNSVVLLRNFDDITEYLNLFPFVIDKNAIEGVKKSKIFFFSHKRTGNGDYYYNYKSIKDDETLRAEGEKYSHVKAQLEECGKILLAP